jgi:ribosomal protein S18 acetylase RimI-like enzyme
MNQNINIRPADIIELEILETFHQKLIIAERPFDSTLANDPIEYYNLEELIQSNNAEVLVASIDDQLIGMGYAKIVESKSYLAHSHHCHMGCMYVEPIHRGKGVIQLIINKLMEWSKSRNITEVRLEVYDQNQSAKKAYEKIGFNAHMLEMRMKI